MASQIICIDMDAFYASVEIRDDPALRGRPLIIGALPQERGVVSTCSYEARKFGVRSAMSIKDAYRLCPQGVYMHPNMHKYADISRQLHAIWDSYTDLTEYISLDEGFLDVTHSAHLFGGAASVGREIKTRVKNETGLTCSVGLGYSLMSAKLASEEHKPDGYCEILTPEALTRLIIDRSVRVIYGVGVQTAGQLQRIGIHTVRDLLRRRADVVYRLGSHGQHLLDLAEGIDGRSVGAPARRQSLGKEHTFQRDTGDFDYLRDVLRLIARELSYELRLQGTYARTVTLKITYYDMKKITRSHSGEATNRANDFYRTAAGMLAGVERRAVRLVGMSLSGLTDTAVGQLSLFTARQELRFDAADAALLKLQRKYGPDILKSASELNAEQNLRTDMP